MIENLKDEYYQVENKQAKENILIILRTFLNLQKG